HAHVVSSSANIDALGLGVLHHVFRQLPDQQLLQLKALGATAYQPRHLADANDVSARLINNVYPAKKGKKVVRAERKEGNAIGGNQPMVAIERRFHGDL